MGEWLESLVPWGTEAILYVQSLSPDWLDPVWAAFTYLGNEQFYLLMFPFIFWCVSKQAGIGLAYASLLSTWLNSAVKHLYKIPRPADLRIRVPLPETSPSFPSNHAQSAVVNWGYMATCFRSTAFRAVAIVLMACISLSRIVLGVHFPQDVVGGLLLGLLVLALYTRVAPSAGRWAAEQRPTVQVILAVGVPLMLIFLHPSDANGRYPAEGAITPMSALVGFGVGLVMERAWVRFRVAGEVWRRGLRFLLGLILITLLYLGPSLVLPEELPYGVEALARFARYAMLGWAGAFLCPWLFVRLGLADTV